MSASLAAAIEEPDYTVIHEDGAFSIRKYPSVLVAETIVSGDQQSAGNRAFRPLFRFISGHNAPNTSIAMTAPLTQEGQNIAMTAPVTQEQQKDQWAVHFVMPAELTLDTVPSPLDSNLTIRQLPARTVAVIRYRGRWSAASYDAHEKALRDWIDTQSLTVIGNPIWARYNSPFSLPIARRNEIWIPVKAQEE